ncbi:enolase C-terminal domain-like protein [Actinophytocola sp.]|uniref:enolase C-terminal domain-like protein n=1 Tax=Actinophytocola sp. TaxID=1872138 RepID=UPI002D7E93C3|nr:enolase C-terminal domain-like protein [Actinophytocola sp.]HET9138974.1 enolase C-terminal domain-like protein [Actinophytocola sp.]
MRVVTTVHTRPLVRPFPVSHMTTSAVDLVTLELSTRDSVVGAGEISADAGYDQDGPAIAAQANGLAETLAADPDSTDPGRLDARLRTAAVSAPARMLVEMAFLDRAARLRGLPVWRLLGLPEPGIVGLVTTVPIGAPLPAAGPVKVKLGGPDDAAVLRDLVGVRGPVILDVNRGWTRADWLALRPLVIAVAPAVLEDPVADPALLRGIRAALPATAMVLDEGIGSQADVERAAETAGGANVKVMKLGGLLPARRALDHLTARGATRMLGCYLEPPRAIAYAAQLSGRADWTDLDGHFWVSPDHPAVPAYRLDSSRPGIPTITF